MQKSVGSILLPFLCLTVLLEPQTTSAQTIDESFRSDIQKLLEVTGAARMGSQAASLVTGQILASMKRAQPQIPDRALEVAKQVLDAEFARAFAEPNGLTQQLVLIYAKHFTDDDVRGLLNFYSSDLGKKTIAMMPVVFQESAAAGQQWTERQMPAIRAVLESRLRAEGLIP